MIYRKFEIEDNIKQQLTPSEREVLSILEGVVEDISKVYKLQLEEGFFDKELTKKEIEKAAIANPEMLSPFTYIVKDGDEIKAEPYHQRYSNLLLPVAEKLKQAAEITENGAFKVYLLARAKSLTNGSYKEADTEWLNVKDSKIDFSAGPFERYLDKAFFTKRVFQSHVGIISSEETEFADQVKEVLYSFANSSPDSQHSTNIPAKGVEVYIEETPATSGYMSDVVFSGEHFPSDLDIMREHGSRIIVYKSQLELKFEKIHYPIFQKLFEKQFASKYSKELLLKATVLNTLLYELGRQLHKFEGARERLKELYGIIDEANGFASGIQHSKYLLVKGLISQDELEAIIIIHIVWLFSDWLVQQQDNGVENYVIGDSIALSSYIKSGAIGEKDGISWPNFARVFFQVEQLADQLVSLLQKGSYEEAAQFIKENSDTDIFKNTGARLEDITTEIS